MFVTDLVVRKMRFSKIVYIVELLNESQVYAGHCPGHGCHQHSFQEMGVNRLNAFPKTGISREIVCRIRSEMERLSLRCRSSSLGHVFRYFNA
jgi:hypothetical protein